MSDTPSDRAVNGEATKPPLPQHDDVAIALRKFGPLGILSILIILGGNFLFVPVSAVLVLIWTRLSNTPLREIGYVRPKNWAATVIVGVAFGATLKFLLKAVVMPILGAPAINPAYHYLVGNTAALPAILYLVIVGAGFGEETLFRGWMFERLGKLLGSSLFAKTTTVLLTSIGFGLAHYAEQGLPGTEQATIFGLLFGTIFAITNRIFMLMIAHAAFDLTAVAIIYWNFENTVAHWLFR